MSVNLKKITLGFIPANRGFFSAQLAAKMRKQTIEAMEAIGIEVVVPGEEDTKGAALKTSARPSFVRICSARKMFRAS